MLSHERRRFDHIALELSLALGVRVPRHSLWIALSGRLGSGEALAGFCDALLDEWLRAERLHPIPARQRARLQRELRRFDPARRTPEEIVGALFAGA